MTIAERVHRVMQLISEHSANRQQPVTLMAVSKFQPVTAIREAYAAGINNFGENYWQEAKEKIERLRDLPLIWHFIGAIQSNKAAAIAQEMQWVHTVDRLKIARLLNQHRKEQASALNVCIQVDLDNEQNKAGLPESEVLSLAKDIQLLPNLRLRGLMAIPKPYENEESQYLSLLRLNDLLHRINPHLSYTMDTLSMGMSDDLLAAIRAGSTTVRIGRAIFGERQRGQS